MDKRGHRDTHAHTTHTQRDTCRRRHRDTCSHHTCTEGHKTPGHTGMHTHRICRSSPHGDVHTHVSHMQRCTGICTPSNMCVTHTKVHRDTQRCTGTHRPSDVCHTCQGAQGHTRPPIRVTHTQRCTGTHAPSESPSSLSRRSPFSAKLLGSQSCLGKAGKVENPKGRGSGREEGLGRKEKRTRGGEGGGEGKEDGRGGRRGGP